MATRVYWPGLLLAVRHLCHYWEKYRAKLPADLQADLATPLAGIDTACLILQVYDFGHKRGRPEDAVGG